MSMRSVITVSKVACRVTLGCLLAIASLLIVFAGQSAWAVEKEYALSARISMSQGAIAAASWLDNDHYLTLMITPAGAEVYRHGYADSTRERFMSAEFIRKYVCPDNELGRLTWMLSPGKGYLFFSWFTDTGRRQWSMVEISNAPDFRLKRFNAPPGMQIAKVLFAPDDRYAVLVHDAVHGDCDVSLLVLDFATGGEAWRLSTEKLNFISELWWGSAMLNAPRFNVAAKLHDGQFESHMGLARLDLNSQSITFTSGDEELLCGDEALWGRVSCRATGTGATPFVLQAEIAGQESPLRIPLSAQPVELQALPEPGLVLLSNTSDWVTNQLWMIDVFSGEKWLVDQDCASFSFASDNKLLVRARTRIELRVYDLVDKLPAPELRTEEFGLGAS